uniref:ARM repeat superfamily protein n=2 Tax=Kalanchoe fedtschenkoi TaxID=63787 RepID=A0A7N0TUR0_KALFE
MEQYDSKQLLEAASEFANHPGVQNDVATRDFLDRFPLPVLFDALQKEPLVPNFENHLVACLERIFRTNHGASLIPQNMSFVQVGLQAGSHVVRCLACKAVSRLLENGSGNSVQLVVGSEVYTLLLDCLIDGNEEESAAAMDAIKGLACSPQGMTLLFPGDIKNSTDLRCLATKCSPLGRVRVLALLVKLFSVSSSVASMVYNSNLLSLLESELTNRTDVLISLTVLELLYELAEIKHATELLSKTNLIKLLCSLISDITTDTILRSRAMLISGRLLSKENIAMFIDDISKIRSTPKAIKFLLLHL